MNRPRRLNLPASHEAAPRQHRRRDEPDYEDPGPSASGGIYLGQIAVQNLHTDWRKVCMLVDVPSDWSYKDPRGGSYPFYRFGS